jgi:hypothetical protein
MKPSSAYIIHFTNFKEYVFLFVFVFLVLRIEPRALHWGNHLSHAPALGVILEQTR